MPLEDASLSIYESMFDASCDPWIILSTRDIYHMLGHIWCTFCGDLKRGKN
jgi:hypothetical protein